MSYDPAEFHSYFRLFELEGHCAEWPLFKSPAAIEMLRNKAASYGGLISISHFCRAFSELKAAGSIAQLRQPKPAEVEEPELTPEAYRKIPARETARRYMQDPDFKFQVDALIAQGKI